MTRVEPSLIWRTGTEQFTITEAHPYHQPVGKARRRPWRRVVRGRRVPALSPCAAWSGAVPSCGVPSHGKETDDAVSALVQDIRLDGRHRYDGANGHAVLPDHSLAQRPGICLGLRGPRARLRRWSTPNGA